MIIHTCLQGGIGDLRFTGFGRHGRKQEQCLEAIVAWNRGFFQQTAGPYETPLQRQHIILGRGIVHIGDALVFFAELLVDGIVLHGEVKALR